MISGSDMNIYSKYDKTSVQSDMARYYDALMKDMSGQLGATEIGTYITFFLMLVVGYHMVSDGVFSSLVTLSSVIQLLGLVLTMLKVQKQKSFGSLSIKSLVLYVPVYVLRLSATMFHEGYLPVDPSGDWAYQAADICSLLVVCWLLFASKHPSYKQSVKEEKIFPSVLCVAGCVALGWFVHPNHNLGTWPDSAWAASLYLETFVAIPQLRLLIQDSNVESLTSHSIACTSVTRAMNLYFWIICRNELSRTLRAQEPSVLPMYFVLSALALQTVLYFDFMFYYVKALVNRTVCAHAGTILRTVDLPCGRAISKNEKRFLIAARNHDPKEVRHLIQDGGVNAQWAWDQIIANGFGHLGLSNCYYNPLWESAYVDILEFLVNDMHVHIDVPALGDALESGRFEFSSNEDSPYQFLRKEHEYELQHVRRCWRATCRSTQFGEEGLRIGNSVLHPNILQDIADAI